MQEGVCYCSVMLFDVLHSSYLAFFPIGPCLCIEWGRKLKIGRLCVRVLIFLFKNQNLFAFRRKATVLNDDFMILWWEDAALCGYSRVSGTVKLVSAPLLHMHLCVAALLALPWTHKTSTLWVSPHSPQLLPVVLCTVALWPRSASGLLAAYWGAEERVKLPCLHFAVWLHPVFPLDPALT